MPVRFTEAFAERLRRASALDVAEARDGEVVRAGQVRVAPGGKNLAVHGAVPGGYVLHVRNATAEDRWVPSVDVLLASAAAVAGRDVLGLVLTGMGKDGAEGAAALRKANASLWVESALTAVIDGMPQAAAAAHGQAHQIPIDQIATLLARVLAAKKTA